MKTVAPIEYELVGGRLFIAPMKARDVVAIEGSVLGGSNFLPKEKDAIAALTAELLDAGTKGQSKAGVREALAKRGITLSFSSNGDRMCFSAQCFPEDIGFLFDVITSCLGGAVFPASEVAFAKERALGELAEERAETRPQAERALANLIYDRNHVNYQGTIDEDIKSVKGATRSDLSGFGKKLGRGGLVLAVTGDVKVNDIRKAAEKSFAKLSKGTLHVKVKAKNRKTVAAGGKLIPIANKANIDVLLGASVGIHKLDELYHSLLVATEMLGGGFAGHLMQTIRERDGLTYGVYSRLSGFDDGADGAFSVWATFSPELYEKSVAALRREVAWFFKNGMTQEALAKKHDEIAGSYQVGLSTTRGMARALHQIGIDGRDLSYIAEFPSIIRKVSVTDIESARDTIPLTKLSFAASGTFPKR